MADSPAPLFSIVTPVWNTPTEVLQETLNSVVEQTFADWELILVNDSPENQTVCRQLHEFAESESRATVLSNSGESGIVGASNTGLAHAQGEFAVLLDHDDLLVPDALASVAATIASDPDIDYIYSDEDKLLPNGEFVEPFLKPDWSPERLRGQNYCCHLSVMRRQLVADLGGFRTGFDGSQDYDLILRVTERARKITHIPKILYHWRVVEGSTAGEANAKPYALEAARRAVEEHVGRVGITADVEIDPRTNYLHLWRAVPDWKLISLIVPTRGTRSFVWGTVRTLVTELVRSALSKTQLNNVEVVVVYDEGMDGSTLRELNDIVGKRLKLVEFREEFNFSRKCNSGFVASEGDVVVFLNDDMAVKSDRWLETLVAPLGEPDVGMTGARLLFEDGSLQHAGHQYGRLEATHSDLHSPLGAGGPFGRILINREVSGLTAACCALRREVFQEVGGFRETLPSNFNDVDLSLKLLARGYRNLYMADAVLYHFESKSRHGQVKQFEQDAITRRWRGYLEHDRFTPGLPLEGYPALSG